MIATFNDVDGNEIIVTITGYKDGIEVNCATDSPITLEISPIGGQIEYFPTVLAKIATVKFIAPSAFFFAGLITASYEMTITRGGTTIFRGQTQKFNSKELFTAAPYEFEVIALPENAYWDKLTFNDTTCGLISINGLLGGVADNEFYDLSNIDVLEGIFKGKSKQEVADQVNASFLATYYGNDGFQRIWVHNYLTYSDPRTLTGAALDKPTITWDWAARLINLTYKDSPSEIFYISEEENNPIESNVFTYTSCEGWGFFDLPVGFFFRAPNLARVYSFAFNLLGLDRVITTNSTYDAELAGGNINSTRIGNIDIKIQLRVLNTFDAVTRYYDFDNDIWTSDAGKKYTISTNDLYAFLNINRDIKGYTSGDFGSPSRIDPEATIEIDFIDLSTLFEYTLNSAPTTWITGGSVAWSIESITTQIKTSISNTDLLRTKAISSDLSRFTLSYNFFLDLIGRFTPLNRSSPEFNNIWPSAGFDTTSDSFRQYSEQIITWLSIYLGSPIARLSCDLKADASLYTQPPKPFLFDYGEGEKLFKVLNGKIDVYQNIFSGDIHEIIQE